MWHHFQYLIGLQRLGHRVTYFEDFGWEKSCCDPWSPGMMGDDPTYGINFLLTLWRALGEPGDWCFLCSDGTTRGLTRNELAKRCRGCDVYLNLSNLNWIPELSQCRRRVLVDTDPVFTQIGALGMGGPAEDYHVRFTYGENVHQPASRMPTAGLEWLPTRQPIVPDLWPQEPPRSDAPFTNVTSWEPIGDQHYEGKLYGGKAREFEPFFNLPCDTGEAMEIAVSLSSRTCDVEAVTRRLTRGGWRARDPIDVTRTPQAYQQYLRSSKAEFSVAKHGYVTTACGWFSDRSAGYLASGRPVVVQVTGFTGFLPCGKGLLAYRDRAGAIAAIESLRDDYAGHCRTARAIACEYFDSARVLGELLSRSAC